MKSKQTIDLKQYNYWWIITLRKWPSALQTAEREGGRGRRELLEGANAAALAQINHPALLKQSWLHLGYEAKPWGSSFPRSFPWHGQNHRKISGCSGLQQAKEETSAPSSCFSTLSTLSTAEQGCVAEGSHSRAMRHQTSSNECKCATKNKNGKASSGKRWCVLLTAQQPEDLSALGDNGFVISLPGKDLKSVEERQHFSSVLT